MRLTEKADSRSVQSFAIKTLGTGILLLADFTLELEMDCPSETCLCAVAPFTTDTPSPIFSVGRGRLYTGYLKRIAIFKLSIKIDG